MNIPGFFQEVKKNTTSYLTGNQDAQTTMNHYRLGGLVLSFALLGCAFAAKYYTGPAEQLAHRYLADFFIVAWLYFCLSVAASRLGPLPKGGLIFAVASAIELFQATGMPDSPGFPRVIVFWIGNTFDPWDFVSYALGTLLAMGIDMGLKKQTDSTID